VALTPDQLTEKLSLLKRRDPGLQLFGAATHHYSLKACLPRAELEAFEGSIGITLPDDYRDFLLRFGNGGAGPGYGLLSLKEAIHEFGNDPLQSLARPFIPPRSARTKVDDRAYPEDGLFPLAHMGCGHMWMIVVTGEARGAIWCYQAGYDYDPASLELPAYPPGATYEQRMEANDRLTDSLLADPSRRLSFWNWYIDWLDRTSTQVPERSSRWRSLVGRHSRHAHGRK
jgi:hypothetical protein